MDLTRDRHATLSGPPALLWPAAAFLAAAGGAAVIRAAVDFDNGIWLVAFLLLVGSVAQLLLALGQSVLHPEGTEPGRVAAEAILWNVGAVLVPLGTLTTGKAWVVAGSAALVAGLLLFGRSALESSSGMQPLRTLYWTLILFMGVSVLTGVALSWAEPWF